MEDTTAKTLPRIGEKAPAFKAVTTQGEIDFPKQFEGSWVILFSHPADFTPVCTSEFMTFAYLEKQFNELNCKLVGLSVDGLYSHIAWLRTIKDKIDYKGMKNIEVTFPLIEDITMEVAKAYGMIQPGESNTKAVRAVFVIDPKGVIRAVIYYPLSLGRNFDELLRVVRPSKPRTNSPSRPPPIGVPGTTSSFPRLALAGSPRSAWKARISPVTTGSSAPRRSTRTPSSRRSRNSSKPLDLRGLRGALATTVAAYHRPPDAP